MGYKLEVEWTGSYPCLCSGEWIIKYNDVELKVPNHYKTRDMCTLGEYSRWYFNEDFEECEENYMNGLDEVDWIYDNYNWIKSMLDKEKIVVTDELLSDLYNKIREQDFRDGSCGGCI